MLSSNMLPNGESSRPETSPLVNDSHHTDSIIPIELVLPENVENKEINQGEPASLDKLPLPNNINDAISIIPMDQPAQEIHLDHNEIIINDDPSEPDEEALDENQPYDACCIQVRPLRPFLYLGPLSMAISDGADIAMSLYQVNKTHLPIVITAGAAAFFTSIGLTGEETRETFDETCFIIKKRRFPSDWEKLSYNQEVAAVSISTLPVFFDLFSKGVQAYYFVIALPSEYNFTDNVNASGWIGLSGTIAFGTSLTVLLTDSADMYKNVRHLLAGQFKLYANTVSHIVSPTLGGLLGALKSFNDSAQGYVAIKSVFSINGATGKLVVGGLNLAYFVPNLFFSSGIASLNALDDFFAYMQEKKFEPKKILAASLSLALALYLAYLRRPLNQSFYQELSNDWIAANTIPDDYLFALSWATLVQETWDITKDLVRPMDKLVNFTCNKISNACEYVYNKGKNFYDYCFSSTEPDDEDNKPLLQTSSDDESDQIVIDVPSTVNTSIQEREPPQTEPVLEHYTDANPHLIFNNFRRLREQHEQKQLKKDDNTCRVM